jgi:phage tail-like protein
MDENNRPLDNAWLASPVEDNDSGLEWDARRNELTLQKRLFQFASSPFEKALTFDQRRGAGRDRYGNWYWIGDSGVEIRVYSTGTGRSAHFWAEGDGRDCTPNNRTGDFGPIELPWPIKLLPLSGLTVTEDHFLVVGVLEPAGLLVFDLHTVGSPRQLLWPPNVPFAPFDMAARPGGGVWILDRLNRCYWALDRQFNVVRLDNAPETLIPDDFQPVEAGMTRQTAARPFPEPITLGLAAPVAALDPVAIEALPNGAVLILDNPPGMLDSLIFHYRLATRLGSPVSTEAVREVVKDQDRPNFHLRGYDFAVVPNRDEQNQALLGKLYVTAINGNQTYAFDLFEINSQLKLQALAEYYPMRLFGGKALVMAGDTPYYDFGESWLPLVEQKRPRFEPEATLLTPIFDGREPDCVWHRLMIDACVPPDCAVDIWSRAANDKRATERAAWFKEPRLHKRDNGSELPFVRQALSSERGTFELLFQRARGQFLQLKLTLRGNGRSTPRLGALRAYYPRFSYLEHYVPGVYREDDEAASFLDRFLANPESFFTAIEDKIAAVQMLFDVDSTPVEALDWLANWFGVVLDPVWDEERRRLFIKHAMVFFQYRGTIRGLLMALHLAFDKCIDESIFTGLRPGGPLSSAFRLVEKYRTRQTPPVVLGDPTELTGPRLIESTGRWTPQQGRAGLIERYQIALGTTDDYPIHDPGSAAWRDFSRATLGFVPSATASDKVRWQAFLARRNADVNALNNAYGLTGPNRLSSFGDMGVPTVLPGDGAPLKDWYEFEGLVLAVRANAHRFTVMLPTPQRLTVVEHQQQLDLATRIVNLEKPAHTLFEVKFYWAMFRIGEARLGEDTLIDLGSRAPQLMPPFVLDQSYLAEGYLAPGHPFDVAERPILGRDRITH